MDDSNEMFFVNFTHFVTHFGYGKNRFLRNYLQKYKTLKVLKNTMHETKLK